MDDILMGKYCQNTGIWMLEQRKGTPEVNGNVHKTTLH